MSKYFKDLDNNALQDIIDGKARHILREIGEVESKMTLQEEQEEMQKPTLMALKDISETIKAGNEVLVEAVEDGNPEPINVGNLIDAPVPEIDGAPVIDPDLMGLAVEKPSATKLRRDKKAYGSVYYKHHPGQLLPLKSLEQKKVTVLQDALKKLGISTVGLHSRKHLAQRLHESAGTDAKQRVVDMDAEFNTMQSMPMTPVHAVSPKRKLHFKQQSPRVRELVTEASEPAVDIMSQRMGDLLGSGISNEFTQRMTKIFADGEVNERDLQDLLRTERIRVRRKPRVNKKQELYRIAKQLGFDGSYARSTAKSLREFVGTGGQSNKTANNDMVAVDSEPDNDDDNQVRLSDLGHELKRISINPMRHMDRIEEILQIFVEQGVMTVKQANEYIRGL